jgi:hypothetical protein
VANHRSTSSAVSTSGSWNVTQPSGLVDGDILVAQVYSDAGTAPGLPSGFRCILSHEHSSTNGIKFKVGVKAAPVAASEPANYGFTQGSGSDGVAFVTAVQDAQLAFFLAKDTRANGTAQVCPTLGRFSASDLMICGAAQDGSGSAITWTAPSGMTEPANGDANSGGFTTAGVATLAGPTNPSGSKSFTASASGSNGAVAWSLVIADENATVTGIRQIADVGSVHDVTAATSTSVPLQSAGSIAVDSVLIARLALDNSGTSGAATTVSVTDPRSNTWTVLAAANRTPGSAANDGTSCRIAYCVVANAYTDGDSLTFNYGNSTTANSIVVEEWAGIDNTTPVAVASTTATGASTAPSVSRTPTAAGQLLYVASAAEGPQGDTFTQDTDTTDGTWSGLSRVASTSGTAASNQATAGGRKVVTGTSAQTWTATITSRDWAVVGLVFAPAPTSQEVTLGRATETDAGRALAISRPMALGKATETDSSRTLTPLHNVTLPRATVTETGRALTLSKIVALNRSVEQDVSRPLNLARSVVLGRAAEADTARDLTRTKVIALGRAIEIDLGRALGFPIIVTLGRAIETDVSRALGISKALSLGRATEADSGRQITIVRNLVLGRAFESDSGRNLTIRKGIAFGRAVEFDVAQILSPEQFQVVVLGRATDTESARPLQLLKGITLARATETSISQALQLAHSLVLPRAVESSFAGTLTPAHSVILGRALEAETAKALSIVKQLLLDRAIEVDVGREFNIPLLNWPPGAGAGSKVSLVRSSPGSRATVIATSSGEAVVALQTGAGTVIVTITADFGEKPT